MSLPMLKNRRVLCLAVESTPGTPATLSSANAFYVVDPIIQPTIPMNKRMGTGSIGPLPGVPGSRGGKLTFSIEACGGGSSAIQPPWASVLLPACGMVSSTNSSTGAATYSPTSSVANFKTLTVGVYQESPSGGYLKRLAGCMGTWSYEGENGKVGTFKFSLDGLWVGASDATMVTKPAFAPIPPRTAQTVLTIASYTPKINKITVDFGAKVVLRPDITTLSGYASAVVTERSATGSIDPEADSVANWDPHGLWVTPTTQAMSYAVGTGTGNVITIAAPAFQFDDVQEGNRDSFVTDDIKFSMPQSAGDDDVSIAFG